jgi:hypothetical protein
VRQHQPALDRLTAVPREGDVEGVNQLQPIIHLLEARVEIKAARFVQRRLPKNVEVGGFVTRGEVNL